ncbi:MAG: plasmid related protein [Ardenticatenaceae bacterium]|nr:plasmid related protein [Ardenticatenaceae bacterium]
MTPGAAELGIDFAPYLARHAQGDWGDDLDSFDERQNDTAVKEGYRILSAYTVPAGDETERIWIITEADRSATTVLLPSEY